MTQPPSDDVYTHGHHPAVLRSHTFRTVENSARYLMPHLQPGRRLLDVGCGPGTITADLAARLHPGSVIGVDRSAAIVEQADSTDFGPGPRDLTFQVDDCYRLSFPDDSFDVVHAHQVLQHLSDPVAALVEMGRVVAPTGVVAVRDADYRAMAWFPRLPELDLWMELYQAVARCNRADPDAGRHLRWWARQAGFTTVECSADVWCFATAEQCAWWGHLWAERVEHSELAVQAVEYGLASGRDLARIAAGWRTWAAHPAAWFAVVNGEVLARA